MYHISLPSFAPTRALAVADPNLAALIDSALRSRVWANSEDSEEDAIIKSLIALYQLTAHFQSAFTKHELSHDTPSSNDKRAFRNKATWKMIESVWLRLVSSDKRDKNMISLGVGSLAAAVVDRFNSLRELHQTAVEDLVEDCPEPRNKLVLLLVKLVWENRRFSETFEARYEPAVAEEADDQDAEQSDDESADESEYEDEEDYILAKEHDIMKGLHDKMLSWSETVGWEGSEEQWRTMWPAIVPAHRPLEPTFENIAEDHRRARQLQLQKFANDYTLRLPEVIDPYPQDQIQILSTQSNVRKTVRQCTVILTEPSNQKGLTQLDSNITKSCSRADTPETSNSSNDAPTTVIFPRLPQDSHKQPTPNPLTPNATPEPEDPAARVKTYRATWRMRNNITKPEDSEHLDLCIHGWRSKDPPSINIDDPEWYYEDALVLEQEEALCAPGHLNKDVYLALEEESTSQKVEQWVRFTKRTAAPVARQAQDGDTAMVGGIVEEPAVEAGKPLSVVVEFVDGRGGGVVLMEIPLGWDVEGPFMGRHTPEQGSDK